MVIKVLLSFLRLFPSERQIESNPLKDIIPLKTKIFLLLSWSKCLVRQQHKFCTATSGPVLAGGKHVTGGLVAAAAARGLLAGRSR